MTIEQSIQKAIEGGWKNKEVYMCDIDGIALMHDGAFLDPSFWQSLGKAMGWREATHAVKEDTADEWVERWHRFIDHLAEGKSIESYFETL